MDLSGIVKEHGVPLTRTESRLVELLPDEKSSDSSDRNDQQMKNLAAARDVLKQMPDRQTSERRSRMEKAAMLKERLKMLRQMLAFLSPSAAKSLKSEMKQIAGQIASLSADGGGGGSAMVVMEMPNAGTTGAKQAETTEESVTTTEVDQGSSENTPTDLKATVTELSGQQPNSNKEANAEERALRESVAELKSLFKTVLEALKHKQKTGRNLRGASQLRAYTALPESGGSLAITV